MLTTIPPFFFASAMSGSLNVPILQLGAVGILVIAIIMMDEPSSIPHW
jgi:hypothetical protein